MQPEIVTGLHIRKMALRIQGISESTPVILTLTNITDLDVDQNTATALQQITKAEVYQN